ncbi:type II toxin-antitoxin system HipA family toxin [Ruania halotolerans]|uniref:type II toxin-antitoxin system HipA family toxin n=1 Tax=Ruania halotolerans TaxID=2897773 RepID=UPI001E3AD7B5|nr:HipA domain-containing protein [Ruania halotolerans]UFU07958.1 HipA domain-containing protein [Ruania halotolerans]
MSELQVELYGEPLGTLRGDSRSYDFAADARALERHGLDSLVLSLAVPLSAVPVRSAKARRQNFFAELLPEGRLLARLADRARVRPTDAFGMLRRYGRDVAGALQIWDPEEPGEPKEPRLAAIDAAGIARLLERENDQPLGNRPTGGKTSLAGVQDKIVLAWQDAAWHQVLDGYPSTHILKPQVVGNPTGLFDEEYGARIARHIGLCEYETRIDTFAGVHALVIERYDRDASMPQGRVHQEDMNQALGASRDQKYQRIGGRVSLARMASAIGSVSPDAPTTLLRMVTAAVALGNLDMHAKNISLLHPPDGSVRMAPAYDMVPMAHQDTDGEMALAVAEEYRHRQLTREHLVSEATAWGLRDVRTVIDRTLEAILAAVREEAPHPSAHPGLRANVARSATNLLRSGAVGD